MWKPIVLFFSIQVIILSALYLLIPDVFSPRAIIEKLTPKFMVVKPEVQPEAPLDVDIDSRGPDGDWRGLCPEGGVSSVGDLMEKVSADPVLLRHFKGFDFSKAHAGYLNGKGRVTYRVGDGILEGRRVLEFNGDPIITDGDRVVRKKCCNDVLFTPPPVEEKPVVDVTEKKPEWIYHAQPIEVMESPLQQWHRPESEVGSRQFFHIDKHERHTPTAPVPEPSTMLLLGAGLAALAAWRKR